MNTEKYIDQMRYQQLRIQKKLRPIRKYTIIIGALIVFLSYLWSMFVFLEANFLDLEAQFVSIMVPGIPTVILFSFIYEYFKRKYTKSYIEYFKYDFLYSLIKEKYPSSDFIPTQGIGKKTFLKSRLYKSKEVDSYHSEDLIKLNINERQVVFSEVEVKERVRSGKKTKYVTIFKGLVFYVDYNKNNWSNLIVKRDLAERFLGNFGKNLQFNPRGLEQINLENPEFENRFKVFGDDQQQARYILTPKTMEKIMKLDDKIYNNLVATGVNIPDKYKNFSGIEFSIINSKLFLTVPIQRGEDLFEPNIWGENPVSKEDLEKYLKYIDFSLDIIDTFEI